MSTALEALVSSMALSDLSERSGKSVEEIVNWAMGGRPSSPGKSRGTAALAAAAAGASPRAAAAPAAAPAPAAEAPARRAGAAKTVNTRTPEGRTRYDEAVLSLVRESDGPIAAATIRKKVGGTPLQVRAALNRLIEAGQVEYQGRARAMRYTAR